MDLAKNDNIKYKLLSFQELVINLDRLSRFKLPEEAYFRVFTSILFKCLIYPKYSKQDLEKLSSKVISKYVKVIWNASVKEIFDVNNDNFEANKALKLMCNIPFKNIDADTKVLMNTKLNISAVLMNIDEKTAPLNLKFLIEANKIFNKNNPITIAKALDLRNNKCLKFPVSKLIIVEGITEEILLPVFASKLKHDFNKEGIYVLGAGGKSKSPNIYMKLREKLRIPVFFLFDNDALEQCIMLEKKVLKKDKIIVIEKGEFEDILSLNLLKRSLNREYETITPLLKDDLHIYNKMCENIEYYYRTRKLGEFKKSKLSKIIAKNIKYKTDVTKEINDIITKLTDD